MVMMMMMMTMKSGKLVLVDIADLCSPSDHDARFLRSLLPPPRPPPPEKRRSYSSLLRGSLLVRCFGGAVVGFTWTGRGAARPRGRNSTLETGWEHKSTGHGLPDSPARSGLSREAWELGSLLLGDFCLEQLVASPVGSRSATGVRYIANSSSAAGFLSSHGEAVRFGHRHHRSRGGGGVRANDNGE